MVKEPELRMRASKTEITRAMKRASRRDGGVTKSGGSMIGVPMVLALAVSLLAGGCGSSGGASNGGQGGGMSGGAGAGGAGRGGASGTDGSAGAPVSAGTGGAAGPAAGGGTGAGGGGTGVGGSGGSGNTGDASSDSPPAPADATPPPPATVPPFCASYPPAPATGQWQSQHVKYQDGRLTYPADAERNRIPDFSYAGYRYGQVPLPKVAEVMRLEPAPGDNTARIQMALDAVGARPLDEHGLRGALVLAPGRYEVAGTLRVKNAGVVLRGSGDGADPTKDTILVATGDVPHQRTVVIAGNEMRGWPEGTPRTNVVTPFVQVGAMTFDVESAAGLAVGDPVVIRHPSSQAWIDALGGGGVVTSAPWTPGSRDIIYHRIIRGIAGNTVTLDAPLFNHLDRKLTQAHLAKATNPYIGQVGVEHLRIDIQTAGGEDENHAWRGLSFRGAIDSWAVKVTVLHFGWAGLEANGAIRITMDDSSAIEPVGIRTGGRFYNFSMEGLAQLVLVRNCFAADGRHSLVGSGASTTSGNVFYRCRMTNGGAVEGGHRQWTQAMLYDNVVETASSTILLINRGDFGTSHGWGCAHSVIWNFNSRMTAQKPPTAQNYAISSQGQKGGTPPFPGPEGAYELRGPGLSPASLYEAQLCDRLRR